MCEHNFRLSCLEPTHKDGRVGVARVHECTICGWVCYDPSNVDKYFDGVPVVDD